MFKNIKNIAFTLYGITFFITLLISAIFPITATLSTVFYTIGKHSNVVDFILQISGGSLLLHILWWLIALLAGTIKNLIIQPNLPFAILSGIAYTLVSLISISTCLILYKSGFIPQ